MSPFSDCDKLGTTQGFPHIRSKAFSMALIHDEIDALFSWNPPPLKPITLPGKKPSTGSCPPAFYDKHFSPEVRLECVKRLPTLVRDLATNVDHALLAASEALPPVDDFFTTKDRERVVRRLEKTITDEKGVANFYDKTAATFCTPLASTLALHPNTSIGNWTGLLVWTQSVSTSGYAIMDGELRVFRTASDDEVSEHKMIAETMESETRHIFEEIRDSQSPFATWEMKSPFAGPLEVMLAVPNLGTFSWTSCTHPNCSMDKKHINENLRTAAIEVGDDALTSPWHLEEALSETSDEPLSAPSDEGSSGTPQRPVKQRITQTTAASASTSSMAQPQPQLASVPMRAAELSVPPGKAFSGTSRQLRPRVTPASASTSMLPPPTIPAKNTGKGKGRQEEEEPARKTKRKRKQGDDDKACKNHHDLTAENLVQQAWAQAVRVDGTIIVLHSSNHELVCVRHRGTRTLYVSDLIEPPTCKDPGYGKLQVGIYVAAIQDMIDRTKQRLRRSQPKSPDGDNPDGGGDDKDDQDDEWGSGSGGKDDQGNGKDRIGDDGHGNPSGGVRKSSQFQGGTERKDPCIDELVTIEKTIQAASKRDMLLLYLQYSVYDSPIPASFIRSAPPIMVKTKYPAPPSSQKAIRTYTPNECLSIVLTSEIGQGATGKVHRGTLKLHNKDGSAPLDVVVKLAFDSQQRDMLRTEYETYRCLWSKGVLRGLTTTLGFFDDTEDGPCALVMLYAGDSLSDKPERILSVSDCRSALSTLASIHRAGILHGDIRRENILVSDSGVTIIDFSHSKRCDDQGAMEEYAQFCSFLGFE